MRLLNQKIKFLFFGRKGIFFTFAAIALALILILSSNVYKVYEMRGNVDVIATRVITMNNFIKDVEDDLEKGLLIASSRAFLSMVQYISNNGTYITNLEDSFNELILNGKLYSSEPSLMKDSTFTDWINKIEIQANKIDILLNFTIINVEINQTDPWHVSVNSLINFTLIDKKNTSKWVRNKEIITLVGIENFEDPLYAVKTSGRVINAMIKAPTTDFVNGNNLDNLLSHINNSYYIESESAPNFLMRLEGNLLNSSTGIESLVNLQELLDQGVAIKDRSAVDYIYFGTQITINHRINQTPPWFKLDDAHLATYEVENMAI